MLRFVPSGAMKTFGNFARRMGMPGLLALAGLLAFARPNVADAGVFGQLTVTNHSEFSVLLFVDDKEVDVLDPGQSETIDVFDEGVPTLLSADGVGVGTPSWELEIKEDVEEYTWRLE